MRLAPPPPPPPPPPPYPRPVARAAVCINFTNESLHNLFIEHVFKLEQEVYVKEEVEWNFVSYEDNQHIIDLIAKRPICVLGLLDEGCATGSGKDSTVLDNMHATFAQPKYKAYTKPKKSSARDPPLRAAARGRGRARAHPRTPPPAGPHLCALALRRRGCLLRQSLDGEEPRRHGAGHD